MVEIIAIIVTVCLFAIPYLWNKYIARPENTIELKFTGGSKRTRAISLRNKKGASMYADEIIRVYDLKWDFELIIRNNSDVDSFYTSIDVLPEVDGEINILNENELNTIEGKSELVLKCNYQKQIESTQPNSPNMRSLPDEFNSLKILLSYKNRYQTKFYTLFDNNTVNPVNFLRKVPKDFIR